MSNFYIKDVYPNKSQYISGDEIIIVIEMVNESTDKKNGTLKLDVMCLDKVIDSKSLDIGIEAQSKNKFCISLGDKADEWQGYGVDVTLICDDKEDRLSTAFDVVSSWKSAPRYGFLSDFYKEDEEDRLDIEQMNKYHLNVVQFYDWMYRHDDLIPQQDYFIDPLDRELSLKAVKNKINLCHEYGMKALGYGAIYAASKEYLEKNKEFALYDNNGKVASLGDGWLSIMNISTESPWHNHIINEFKKSVEILDFDGIHMDTYGFPKKAYSMIGGNKKLENLGEQFPTLINNTRKELEKAKDDIGLIFNSVSNWSVETIAPAEEDAVYIEVWDPCDRYRHLYELINNAKNLGKKPVILAAYLDPYLKENEVAPEHAENSFLLTSAVIFASGGYHLLLGENNGILAHPYYVRYGYMREEFERIVRNYYDFIVRYGNLLFDQQLIDNSMTHANGINDEFVFENGEFSSYGEPNKVWTIVKEMPGYKTINLINLTGVDSDVWNEPKDCKPKTLENITVKAMVEEEVEGVYMASPFINDGKAIELQYDFTEHSRGKAIKFEVPQLDTWNLIYIKTKK